MEQAIDHEKRERSIILAKKIELLFAFCAELIPDMDLLAEVAHMASDRVGTVQAMAPILGAVGMDWEAAESETVIRQQRATALLRLISTLKKTEDDRAEFAERQIRGSAARDQISRMLGL